MAKLNLNNIPKPVKMIAAILPAVIFIVLFGLFVIKADRDKIITLDSEIQVQLNDIAKSQRMADKKEVLERENEQLVLKLKELNQKLPEEQEVSQLLKQVSDKGIEAGLTILSWKPSNKRQHPSGIVFEVPVLVTLHGSYHRLGLFFSELTKLDRIVNITNIKLINPKIVRDEAILDVSFAAVTFIAATKGGLSEKGDAKPEEKKK